MKYPDVFIDVYMPIAGWKPRMMAVDKDCGGIHTPWETGSYAYATKEEAVKDAKQWAGAEEVPFIDTCPDLEGDASDKSVKEQLREIFGDDMKFVDLDQGETR